MIFLNSEISRDCFWGKNGMIFTRLHRTGFVVGTGAIAPVDFVKEAQIEPIGHDSIPILAPVV